MVQRILVHYSRSIPHLRLEKDIIAAVCKAEWIVTAGMVIFTLIYWQSHPPHSKLLYALVRRRLQVSRCLAGLHHGRHRVNTNIFYRLILTMVVGQLPSVPEGGRGTYQTVQHHRATHRDQLPFTLMDYDLFSVYLVLEEYSQGTWERTGKNPPGIKLKIS